MPDQVPGNSQGGTIPVESNVKEMVKGTIGTINEFNLKDCRANSSKRLSIYCIANDVEHAKKVPMLLTTLGSEGYSLLKDLCTPALPSTRSFEELLKLISDHIQPKPSNITERSEFKERMQGVDESIEQFITSLKKL